MTTTQDTPVSVPDLRDVPLDQIEAEAGPGIARAIALYRERLEGNGRPAGGFNSKI